MATVHTVYMEARGTKLDIEAIVKAAGDAKGKAKGLVTTCEIEEFTASNKQKTAVEISKTVEPL